MWGVWTMNIIYYYPDYYYYYYYSDYYYYPDYFYYYYYKFCTDVTHPRPDDHDTVSIVLYSLVRFFNTMLYLIFYKSVFIIFIIVKKLA